MKNFIFLLAGLFLISCNKTNNNTTTKDTLNIVSNAPRDNSTIEDIAEEKIDRRYEKKIQGDNHGIAYDDVFDNMHYNQPHRPQVHYVPIAGQVADVTGLVQYKGTYHLFYMFDEWSNKRKHNKNWGYATSNDLIYWEQKPQVLNTVLDHRPGSGCGIVDWNNTLKLQSGSERTLAIFYTDYVRGICMSISRDAGKTWIRHKNNPIIPMPKKIEKGKSPRDPLVFWYKPDQSWILLMYEHPGYTFYKSDNLTEWKAVSKIEGFYECPDFVELPLDGNEDNKKWVIIDGNCDYRVGDFNGTEFILDNTINKQIDYSGDLYASQTWKQSYEGDGPYYQMAMLKYKGRQTSKHDRTWTNLHSFPSVLSLKTINGEAKLCRKPIIGIKSLRSTSWLSNDIVVKPNKPFKKTYSDVMEILLTIDNEAPQDWTINVRGKDISFDSGNNEITFNGKKALISSMEKTIDLHMIIDRSSIEIFVNQGDVCFSNQLFLDVSNKNIKISSTDKPLNIDRLEVYQLESIWLKREHELGYFR